MVQDTEVIALSCFFEACSLVASHELHVVVFLPNFALAAEQRSVPCVRQGILCATCRSDREMGGYEHALIVKLPLLGHSLYLSPSFP